MLIQFSQINIASKPCFYEKKHKSEHCLSCQNKDIFVTNKQFYPIFKGKKEKKYVEDTLKNIDNLHDPYSEIILLPKNKYKKLTTKISQQTTAKETSEYLYRYKHHMFQSDRNMLQILSEHSNDTRINEFEEEVPADFHSILQDLYPNAEKNLIKSQLEIVNSIRQISNEKLSNNSKNIVENHIEKIETEILNNNFRIKKTRNFLEELYDTIPEKGVVDEMMEETLYFPNSATSTDAFIVKNADKTHQEIADLLISPAIMTIEHIKPTSQKGKDKVTNYIAASRRMNNLRQSMQMNQFIQLFPDIPKYTQVYFDDLICKINNGELVDLSIPLEDVKNNLYIESKGLINVDLSKYKS